MATEIVIVQHAEKARWPGDPELTEHGVEQAVVIARLLAQSRWDGLWTSPQRRARETANVIGAHCDLVPVVDDRLRERMNWDGTRAFEEFLADWQRVTADRTWTPPVGDSSHATSARMRAALDDIAKQAQRALVVSHGGATLDLVRDIAGDEAVHSFVDDGIPPCALTTLVHDGAWRAV